MSHQFNSQPIRETSMCHLCNVDYGTKEAANQHFVFNHLNYPDYCKMFRNPLTGYVPLMCFGCTRIFPSLSELNYHMATQHQPYYEALQMMNRGEAISFDLMKIIVASFPITSSTPTTSSLPASALFPTKFSFPSTSSFGTRQ